MFTKKLRARGALFVEYALLLAFVVTAGVVFLSSGFAKPITGIFTNAEEKLSQAANATGPKYNIAQDAAAYKDAIEATLNYLDSNALIHSKGTLSWMLFRGNGQLDNYSIYKAETGLQGTTITSSSTEEKNEFYNGLVAALDPTEYSVIGGSIFYDREGNVAYNNANAGGANQIGGQGRYTNLKLTNKTTKEVSYVYYGADNTWHYTATVPTKGNYMEY